MGQAIIEAIVIIGKIVLKLFQRGDDKDARDQKIIDEINEAFKKRDGSGIARNLNRWWRLRR